MGVKTGRWHWGRKGSWGCLRIWCCWWWWWWWKIKKGRHAKILLGFLFQGESKWTTEARRGQVSSRKWCKINVFKDEL